MANESDAGQDGKGQRPPFDQLSEPIRTVLDALTNIRFGAIQMTVHEGKLVQVDITERKRFSN